MTEIDGIAVLNIESTSKSGPETWDLWQQFAPDSRSDMPIWNNKSSDPDFVMPNLRCLLDDTSRWNLAPLHLCFAPTLGAEGELKLAVSGDNMSLQKAISLPESQQLFFYLPQTERLERAFKTFLRLTPRLVRATLNEATP